MKTALGTTPTFAAPMITGFTVSGIDPANPPLAGTALGGNRVITRMVSNSGNVQGNLELFFQTGNAAPVSQAIDLSPTDTMSTEDIDDTTACSWNNI